MHTSDTASHVVRSTQPRPEHTHPESATMLAAAATPLPAPRGDTPPSSSKARRAAPRTSLGASQSGFTPRQNFRGTAAVDRSGAKYSQHVRASSGSSEGGRPSAGAAAGAASAASMALRNHRLTASEAYGHPEIQTSAGRAATAAARGRGAPLRADAAATPAAPSAASEAATAAHANYWAPHAAAAAAAHEAAPSALSEALPDSEVVGGEGRGERLGERGEGRPHNALARAASITVAKRQTQRNRPEPEPEDSGAGRRVRSMNTAQLNEAAAQAAARRLALLDKELAEASRLRIPVPQFETRRNQGLQRSATTGSKVSYQADYDLIMETARRNVEKRLALVDHQVAQKRGLRHRTDREMQSLRQAEERSAGSTERRNNGRINIGGGRYVDEALVTEAASRNLKPVLEDITARAEAQRARDAAERAEIEERKRQEAQNKEREREMKEARKVNKAAEKHEQAQRRDEEKQVKKQTEANKLSLSHILHDPEDEEVLKPKKGKDPTSPKSESKSGLRRLFTRLRSKSTSESPSSGEERFSHTYGVRTTGQTFGEREQTAVSAPTTAPATPFVPAVTSVPATAEVTTAPAAPAAPGDAVGHVATAGAKIREAPSMTAGSSYSVPTPPPSTTSPVVLESAGTESVPQIVETVQHIVTQNELILVSRDVPNVIPEASVQPMAVTAPSVLHSPSSGPESFMTGPDQMVSFTSDTTTSAKTQENYNSPAAAREVVSLPEALAETPVPEVTDETKNTANTTSATTTAAQADQNRPLHERREFSGSRFREVL
ncbi:hypothetical protein DFH27DRAFT_33010 [Peziza echinospora]|nr:hypothetical protein DFH27DRAFT_33010 [Peziza echinospora]